MGECTKVQCTPLTSRKSGSIVENASLIVISSGQVLERRPVTVVTVSLGIYRRRVPTAENPTLTANPTQQAALPITLLVIIPEVMVLALRVVQGAVRPKMVSTLRLR
jgi:hypothetical protein